jgi:hypothetical protein
LKLESYLECQVIKALLNHCYDVISKTKQHYPSNRLTQVKIKIRQRSTSNEVTASNINPKLSKISKEDFDGLNLVVYIARKWFDSQAK